MPYSAAEHSICEHPERGYATFSLDAGTSPTLYALAFSQTGDENLTASEPWASCEVWATDCTGECFLYTNDPWLAEHTKAYILSCDQLSAVESGECLVSVRSGEIVSREGIESSGRAHSIGHDWDGMGVEYVGVDFLSGCLFRIDFENAGIVLFVGIGD